MEDRSNQGDWSDFTLNITVMPPEPAGPAGLADDELLPTRPFRKPTLDQLSPTRKPPAESRPLSVPLPLRAGTLHSVAGLPLPPGPLPRPAATPAPRTTLESLRATTGASRPTLPAHRASAIADGPQQARNRPSAIADGPQQARNRPSAIADGPQQARNRPSSRLTPAFGARLTPTSGIRRVAAQRADGSRPGASRRNRSRWARDLLQRFNFDDCA